MCQTSKKSTQKGTKTTDLVFTCKEDAEMCFLLISTRSEDTPYPPCFLLRQYLITLQIYGSRNTFFSIAAWHKCCVTISNVFISNLLNMTHNIGLKRERMKTMLFNQMCVCVCVLKSQLFILSIQLPRRGTFLSFHMEVQVPA